jgi:Leucine-rich repeat (LRR) protein
VKELTLEIIVDQLRS